MIDDIDDFEKIIERVRAAKLRWPSLRFGQMLQNVLADTGDDLYYMSDAALLEGIETYMENN